MRRNNAIFLRSLLITIKPWLFKLCGKISKKIRGGKKRQKKKLEVLNEQWKHERDFRAPTHSKSSARRHFEGRHYCSELEHGVVCSLHSAPTGRSEARGVDFLIVSGHSAWCRHGLKHDRGEALSQHWPGCMSSGVVLCWLLCVQPAMVNSLLVHV